MHWLLWVIAYAIIIAGIAWTIIPEKPLWLILTIITVIGGSIWLLNHWPEKWTEKEKKKEG